jgi:hypothetical protein
MHVLGQTMTLLNLTPLIVASTRRFHPLLLSIVVEVQKKRA